MNTVELSTLNQDQSNSKSSAWRDWLGIVASVGCAIHCAAMPFVIAYLPALGLSFLADEAFHKWMALACFLIAIAAFVPGLRKHGSWFPVSVATVGLVLITFAAFGLAGECCASCESTGGAAVAAAGCEHCDHCASCSDDTADSAVAITAEDSDEEEGLLSTLAPWITPVGGILLVGAHLLNRRYGCLCGCCGPAAASVGEASVA